MDIIFQSGEFFGQPTGFLSKILPILGVIVGFSLYWIKDQINEGLRMEKLVEYFRTTLKQLIYQLDNELTLITKAKKQNEIRQFILIETINSVSLKTDRLFNTISYTDLTSIFSKYKLKQNEYLLFISYIDILDNYVNNVTRINNTIHETYIKNYSDLEKVTNEVFNYMSNLKSKEKLSAEESDLVLNWQELVNKYYQLNTEKEIEINDPYVNDQLLFDPMYKYLISDDFKLIYFRELKNLITQSKVYLQKQDNFRRLNISTFDNYYAELFQVRDNFINVYNLIAKNGDEKFH